MTINPQSKVYADSTANKGTLLGYGLDVQNASLEQCQLTLRVASSGLLDLELGTDNGFRVEPNSAYKDDPRMEHYLTLIDELLKQSVNLEENRTAASAAAHAINHFAAQLDEKEPLTIPGVPNRMTILKRVQHDQGPQPSR